MPKISVILPVFNAEKYLIESLESLSDQTYRDFEIIAINDGSTDNSLNILQEYAKKEPRLRILSRENKGITKTLNEGIDFANGEYIARMDADDISLPKRFELQLEFIEKNNLDICGTQYIKFGTLTGISNLPLKCEDCYFALLLNSPFGHPSILIKTEIIKKYKYNENIKYAQDYDLWCRMALDNIRMGNLPLVLLKYRYCSNSITSSKKPQQKYFAQSIGKNYWNKCEISKDIPYPICVIDTDNKNVNELKKSLQSLIELQKRFLDSSYMNDLLNSLQLMLLGRLSIYGLNNVLSFLKRNKNIKTKTKFLYAFMALTKAMLIKEFIMNLLSNSLKEKIRKYLYENI